MRTFILIPTYNERANLPVLVTEILATTEAEIMVLDDDSPDGTGYAADVLARDEPRLRVVHRARREGVGPAYRDGFRRALEAGAEVVFQMDADFAHQPRYLPELAVALANADMVVGSRYVDGGTVENWGFGRRMVSRASNSFARRVLQLPVRDATSGFVGMRRHVLEAIDFDTITSDGYAFQIELKQRAYELGFTIVEVPIIFYDRTPGASKLSRRTISEAARRVIELRLKHLG